MNVLDLFSGIGGFSLGLEWAGFKNVSDPNDKWKSQQKGSKQNIRRWFGNKSWWKTEPDVGRVANGIPNRVHRLKQLGNAVVPQIPYLIGKAILEYEK